jgi:GT2 family glycosyltransferase
MEPKATRSKTATVGAGARVSAIVVTFHTGESLELCLRSLFAEPWVDEVILVDNGNPVDVSSSFRALQADRRDVLLIQGHGNVGFARACNMGASEASGRLLLFVNPDAVLQRGAAEHMAQAGRKARSPWIVGGKLVDKDGREQRASRRNLLTPWTAVGEAIGLGSLGAARLPRAKGDNGPTVAPVPVVSGAFMMTPKADFDSIGGFDEGYFLHVEDIDICRRVGEAGGAVLFEPAAEALHFGSTSKTSWLKVERHKARGFARYFRKFARTPGERVLAAVVSPWFGFALFVRGCLRAAMRRK